MEVCSSMPGCQGFQYCFLTPGVTGNAAGRVRLKGGSAGALNVSNAVYNPYCRYGMPLAVPSLIPDMLTMPLAGDTSERNSLRWEGGGKAGNRYT